MIASRCVRCCSVVEPAELAGHRRMCDANVITSYPRDESVENATTEKLVEELHDRGWKVTLSRA